MRKERAKPPVVTAVPRRDFNWYKLDEVASRFQQTFSLARATGWTYKGNDVNTGEPYFTHPTLAPVTGKETFLRRYGIVLTSASAQSPSTGDAEEARRRRISTGATPIAVVVDLNKPAISQAWETAWPGLCEDGWKECAETKLYTHANVTRKFDPRELLEAYKIIGYEAPTIETTLTAPPELSEAELEKVYTQTVCAQHAEMWPMLRTQGWTWTWGTNAVGETIDIFVAPGTTRRDSVLGTTRFESKEALLLFRGVEINAVKPGARRRKRASSAHATAVPAQEEKQPVKRGKAAAVARDSATTTAELPASRVQAAAAATATATTATQNAAVADAAAVKPKAKHARAALSVRPANAAEAVRPATAAPAAAPAAAPQLPSPLPVARGDLVPQSTRRKVDASRLVRVEPKSPSLPSAHEPASPSRSRALVTPVNGRKLDFLPPLPPVLPAPPPPRTPRAARLAPLAAAATTTTTTSAAAMGHYPYASPSWEKRPNRVLGDTTDPGTRMTPSRLGNVKAGDVRQPVFDAESPPARGIGCSESTVESPPTPVMSHVAGKPVSPVAQTPLQRVLGDLNARFPEREAVLNELVVALALVHNAPLFVYGAASTGKSTMLSAVALSTLASCVFVSAADLCGQGAPRLFSLMAHQLPRSLPQPAPTPEPVNVVVTQRRARLATNREALARLFSSSEGGAAVVEDDEPKSSSPPSEGELLMPMAEARTVAQFAAAVTERVAPSDDRLVIIVDDVDLMTDVDASVWTALCQVGRQTRRAVDLVFIARCVPEAFEPVLRATQATRFEVPQYTPEQIERILARAPLPADCPSADVYAFFLREVFKYSRHLARDLREWRYAIDALWPAYYGPVKAGRDDAMDQNKARKNMEPQREHVRRRLGCRDVPPVNDHEDATTQADVQAAARAALDAASALPFLCKVLVAACYLASYRGKETDKVLFGVGKRSRTTTHARQPKSAAEAISVAHPQPFEVERARYIFLALLHAETDVKDDARAMHEFEVLLMTLQSLRIVERVTSEDEIDDAKFRCCSTLEFASNVARLAHFDLAKWL